MFDFLAGGKRKLNLIRELLERRMSAEGYDALTYKLQIKELSNTQLLSTPEGSLVTILETVVKGQKRGMLLVNIISNIENHRKRLGTHPETFNEILQLTLGDNPGAAVGVYCVYRMDLEHPNILSEEQTMESIMLAMEEVPRL